MATQVEHAISPTRAEDYPEWYQQVVRAADLAENAPVRGCMVIKPWGYAIWENIQRLLDARFRALGVRNAYFPLFIPLSFLVKEAKHVEGFAKECAVVTHHRLESDGQGGLRPAAPLEEPLVVRPTSETIIGAMFAKWVQSYRDLPLLINQWANVVRWEMRPRLFLRTAEFLWQEGHTVHATAEEAMAFARQMLDVYAEFAESCLAIPVVKGEKTESERFPGAEATFTIEAMMQDRKALQAGTSHFLGQNFAKASDIKFLGPAGREEYAWTTSWGVSTRLIGAIVMTHGDDDGLVVPPRVAPAHVAILPVIHKEEHKDAVLGYCERLKRELEAQQYAGQNVRVELDLREMRGGEKVWEWIKKGVPIRLEIGPRDVTQDAVFMGRRDRPPRQRESIPRAEFVNRVGDILAEIQANLLAKARNFRDQYIVRIDNKADFYEFFTPKNPENPEIHGGFALCHWAEDPEVEARLKDDLQVSVRCIPLDLDEEPGVCPFTGKPSRRRVIFAKAY
ncbi:MAG: proline--tRNA ligase [Thermoguttaceae bacterium]|nr:proline--tRNA ligase [Thermoguttaceae bacterium]MDW8078018.1 proline--tRNA ligase [Thermoguttaceae bacterium]